MAMMSLMGMYIIYGITDQECEMARPFSLLTSRLESARQIHRASLTRPLVVFVASSNTRVWSHSTW